MNCEVNNIHARRPGRDLADAGGLFRIFLRTYVKPRFGDLAENGRIALDTRSILIISLKKILAAIFALIAPPPNSRTDRHPLDYRVALCQSGSLAPVTSFFHQLFGDAPPFVRVSVWTLPDRRSYHLAPEETLFTSECAKLSALGRDVYVGLATRRPGLLQNQRGKVADCVSLKAFWLDVDREGPGHKATNLPKTEDDLGYLLAAGPPPSMVVDSGGGWHCYWVFQESWRIDNRALVRTFQAPYIARAEANGWHLDDTGTVDRVLRVPGTLNYKVK